MRIRHSRHSRTDARPCVNPHAAGLDIGSEEIWACVPEDRDAQPVRPFGTFTPDLYALAEWLAACRIETVAMESTGVYWIPSLRDSGGAGLPGAPGQCAPSQACAGAQERCEGLSVDSVLAYLWPAERLVSPGRRDVRVAGLLASPGHLARASGRPYPAHAEGPAADERAADPGADRHHRHDRAGHHPCDRRRASGTRFSWRDFGIGAVRAARRRSPRR